jgi:hypothetical protein
MVVFSRRVRSRHPKSSSMRLANTSNETFVDAFRLGPVVPILARLVNSSRHHEDSIHFENARGAVRRRLLDQVLRHAGQVLRPRSSSTIASWA